MNHVGEKPADPLTILVYPSEGSGESVLYEDAGNGFGYERGEYARCRAVCEVSGDEIMLRLGEREGSFVPEREAVRLELGGVAVRPKTVSVNGGEADWCYEEADRKVVVSLEEAAREVVVEIRT
jgi:alpha-glucosidase